MKGNADSTPPGFDRDDAPDLSTGGWPAKFAKATVRRGRPRVERPKVSTTIRLSPEVMDYFKAGGRGWQTRIDAALRDWIGKQREGRPRHSGGAAWECLQRRASPAVPSGRSGRSTGSLTSD